MPSLVLATLYQSHLQSQWLPRPGVVSKTPACRRILPLHRREDLLWPIASGQCGSTPGPTRQRDGQLVHFNYLDRRCSFSRPIRLSMTIRPSTTMSLSWSSPTSMYPTESLESYQGPYCTWSTRNENEHSLHHPLTSNMSNLHSSHFTADSKSLAVFTSNTEPFGVALRALLVIV